MTTDLLPRTDLAPAALRAHLDGLAAWTAARLEVGDVETAWALTRALEESVGAPAADEPRPPSPVIGRRFAAAHAARLRDAVRVVGVSRAA